MCDVVSGCSVDERYPFVPDAGFVFKNQCLRQLRLRKKSPPRARVPEMTSSHHPAREPRRWPDPMLRDEHRSHFESSEPGVPPARRDRRGAAPRLVRDVVPAEDRSASANVSAGAEALARIRHPSHGVLLPDTFLPGIAEASLARLTEHALISALANWSMFEEAGVNLHLAVNVPAACCWVCRSRSWSTAIGRNPSAGPASSSKSPKTRSCAT